MRSDMASHPSTASIRWTLTWLLRHQVTSSKSDSGAFFGRRQQVGDLRGAFLRMRMHWYLGSFFPFLPSIPSVYMHITADCVKCNFEGLPCILFVFVSLCFLVFPFVSLVGRIQGILCWICGFNFRWDWLCEVLFLIKSRNTFLKQILCLI